MEWKSVILSDSSLKSILIHTTRQNWLVVWVAKVYIVWVAKVYIEEKNVLSEKRKSCTFLTWVHLTAHSIASTAVSVSAACYQKTSFNTFNQVARGFWQTSSYLHCFSIFSHAKEWKESCIPLVSIVLCWSTNLQEAFHLYHINWKPFCTKNWLTWRRVCELYIYEGTLDWTAKEMEERKKINWGRN